MPQTFAVPATTAAELAAAFFQATVTLGLAALFTVLWRRYGKPYFGWFALAWFLYAFRLGAITSFLLSENWIWLYWHQVVTGWTALVLLWAALVFSRQLRWHQEYLAAVLFPPLWSYVAIYRMDNFLLAAGPAVGFLSLATMWTGWSFFRHYRRVGARAAAFLAGALFLWGLHHLDYPFLRARGAWTPWGYYLDLLFVLSIGAGILLLVVEDLQRGLGALVALSNDLQRREPENDLPGALLTRILSLAGVRGSAMYACEDGTIRHVRGVGACAGWEARGPPPAVRAVIAHMLETGQPETVGDELYPFVASLPVLRGDVVTGALVVVGDARDPFAALDNRFLLALGRQVGAALANVDLTRRLETRSAELERLTARMVQQHESERRRLSRELHDETAQVFSAVKLQLGILRELAAPDLASRLDRALELIDTGITGIRNVTHSLRPPLLDELGALPALRALAEECRQRGDLAIEFEAPDQLPPLSEPAELALYRALQEGLANVLRHADATGVHVAVVVTNGTLELAVTDDGRGVSAEGSLDDLERQGHMGLAGMRERIAALGGSVAISRAPAGGTSLVVRIPTDPLTP